MTSVAVAGATGVVGRHVATALRAAGHGVVGLSRSGGVDVATGAGLHEALDGVEAVVDVLNVGTQSAVKARAFFGTTTRALLDAERARGVRHHLLLSIVGIDQVPTGYYAGKLHQEQLVQDGPVPWTILRATQFHEFAGQLLATTTVGPVAVVPAAPVRPVSAAEVGALLAELAVAEPRRTTLRVRGPRDEELVDLARRTLAARGERRLVVPLPLPGRAGRAVRGGALRGDESAQEGRVGFAAWLEAQSRSPQA